MAAQQDVSGFHIFSQGDLGSAHVMAHRMLDLGDAARGHAELGAWLAGRSGQGSDWVHVQWHMLVFELGVGEWQRAHERCLREVLPAAAAGDDAATDAPAALWRLWLAAPQAVALPWGEVRKSALGRLHRRRPPYVVLHDLLALAGATDRDAISDWLRRFAPRGAAESALPRFARGFLAFAEERHAQAARELSAALPALPALGGSRAQNELFFDVFRRASLRSAANDVDIAADWERCASGFR